MSFEILYIEDNDNNFYLVNFILNSKGYRVTRAHDGVEGIDLATKMDTALILLDIQLPVMDGYAVARELRKNATLAKVPIIALTSYAMAGDREKALDAGCNGYIEKPINPQTFSIQIEKYLFDGSSQKEIV